jgi:predicted glycoside hydrolase/deacetylase ChbG (UPF0249 family)
MKPVILNADDYAMDEGVDAAILALAERGIVTAASAMALSPAWSEAGRRLLDVRIDRGLHLDLTSPFADGPAGPPSLLRLMAAAYRGGLDRRAIRQSIDRQLERFDAVTHAPPDFVDGHQHVHQLPVIGEELIAALKARYGEAASAIALRLCRAHRWRGVKASIIAGAGARDFSRRAAQNGHPVNTDFAGVYGFSTRADLAALWRRWLASLAGERPLIMCHVAAHADAGTGASADHIRGARLNEWKWLASNAFQELCSELAIQRAGWRYYGA